ncbi:CU044_2847 family protein [Streptomyces sp. NPDC017673]|uniref:CU044_2847 family protein n=1 Tax=unclassified Streptomyces TaxID=2593676 RepID=UPI0037ACC63D
MADFVEFTFDDGTALALQVFDALPSAHAGPREEADGQESVPGFGRSRPVARGSRVVAATEGALNAVLAPLVPLLQRVHDTVAAVPNAPDELAVGFGVRVGADLKLSVVGATGEATMTITATWRLPSPAVPAPSRPPASVTGTVSPPGSAPPSSISPGSPSPGSASLGSAPPGSPSGPHAG